MYRCPMSLVQLSYPIRTQNIRLLNVNKIMLISCMVSPCVHSSVHEFASGYISPVPSLSFLPNQWLHFSSPVPHLFAKSVATFLQSRPSAFCQISGYISPVPSLSFLPNQWLHFSSPVPQIFAKSVATFLQSRPSAVCQISGGVTALLLFELQISLLRLIQLNLLYLEPPPRATPSV
jgi:hypothetical protein